MKKTMNKGLAITLGVLGVIVFAMTIGGCGGRSHTEEPRPEEIRLSTPTNVRVDGGYLRWDTVEYANQYRVFINGGSPTTHLASVNYFNVSGLVHGTHRLAVAAVGFTHTDGRIFLDSYASSYITFNHTPPTEPGEPEPEKLGTPENLRIDGNYVRWNPVTNATGYDVTITRDKYEVKSGKVTTNYFYLNDLLGAGNEYMITVMAVDATGTYLSGTYVYITHNVPEETEPGEPEPEKLGTPENLRVDGNYVRWDAVTNATGYDVTITRDKYEVKSDKVTTNYFYLNDLLGAGNEYMITVMAVDATGTYLPGTYAYITHNVPNVYVPTLTAPTNVRIENGYLRWDAAAGATNARIYANGTMIATGTFTQYYADYLIDLLYSVAGHGAGETVTLTVVVSGYGYNESAQSEGFQFTIPTEYIPDPGPSPDDQYAADAVSNEISRLLGIIQYEKYNDMDINELEQLAQYVTSVKTAFGELTDVQQGLVTNWNNDNVTNLADLYTRVGERAGTKRTAATEFNTTIGEKRGLTAGDLDIAAARESRTTLGSLVSTFPTFTADQAALISNWDSYALDTLRNELTARIETLTTTAMQGVHTLTSRNGEAFTNGYLQIQITNNDIEFFANGYPIAGGTFKLYTESRNDAWIIMDVPAGEMTSLLGILGYGHDHITDVQIALSFDDTNIIAETTFNYNDTPSTHRYEFVAGGQLVEPTPKPDPDEEALEYVRGHYNALRGVYETADVTRAQLHAAHMTAYNALSALRPELRDQLTNVSEFLTGSSQPRINAMMRDKIQGVYTLTRRNGVDFAGDEKFQFRIEESVIAFYTNGTPIADGTIDIDWETVNWTIDAGQKTKLVNVLGYGHDHIENVQMGPFTITDDRELTTTMNFDYEGTPAVHTYEFQHGGLIYDPNVTLAAEIYAINEIIAGLGGHGDFAAEEFDNALQTIDSLKTRIAALPTTGNRDDLNMAGFNSARARAINTLFASAAGTTDYHQLYSYVNKIDARITDDADRELLVEHGMHPEHLDRLRGRVGFLSNLAYEIHQINTKIAGLGTMTDVAELAAAIHAIDMQKETGWREEWSSNPHQWTSHVVGQLDIVSLDNARLVLANLMLANVNRDEYFAERAAELITIEGIMNSTSMYVAEEMRNGLAGARGHLVNQMTASLAAPGTITTAGELAPALERLRLIESVIGNRTDEEISTHPTNIDMPSLTNARIRIINSMIIVARMHIGDQGALDAAIYEIDAQLANRAEVMQSSYFFYQQLGLLRSGTHFDYPFSYDAA